MSAWDDNTVSEGALVVIGWKLSVQTFGWWVGRLQSVLQVTVSQVRESLTGEVYSHYKISFSGLNFLTCSFCYIENICRSHDLKSDLLITSDPLSHIVHEMRMNIWWWNSGLVLLTHTHHIISDVLGFLLLLLWFI